MEVKSIINQNYTTMKKILITLTMLLLPAIVSTVDAQGLFSSREYSGGRQDYSVYAVGNVPIENGMVVFKKIFEIPMKKEALYTYLAPWASFRFAPNTENGKWPAPDFFKNTEYSRILKADKEEGRFKIQGNEDLVFTDKALNKDVSNISYILNIYLEDGKVTAEMSNITYTYVLSDKPEKLYAEDWITDGEAFNRNGKLRKVNGKFRVKTSDLKDAIFDQIKNTLMNIE